MARVAHAPSRVLKSGLCSAKVPDGLESCFLVCMQQAFIASLPELPKSMMLPMSIFSCATSHSALTEEPATFFIVVEHSVGFQRRKSRGNNLTTPDAMRSDPQVRTPCSGWRNAPALKNRASSHTCRGWKWNSCGRLGESTEVAAGKLASNSTSIGITLRRIGDLFLRHESRIRTHLAQIRLYMHLSP